MTDTVNAPRERIEAFIKTWVSRSGNGNIIYGMGMEDDVLELTVSDLRAMLEAAPKAEPVSHPAPASDELLEALAPFARYYDLNDCHERRPDDALEVPISDLARAAHLVAKHKGPQS